MYDQYLLNAIRVLNTQEKLKNDKSNFMVGCPKDVFDTFRDHPVLGKWLSDQFPHTLAVIDAYFDEPVEDRSMYEDPFRYLITKGAPIRVLLISEVDGNIHCSFPDWSGNTVREVIIRNPAATVPVGEPGTFYDFFNPSSTYIEPLFLSGVAPIYTHALAQMMADVVVELLASEEGVDWGNTLAARSLAAAKAV